MSKVNKIAALILALAVGLAIFASPFASSSPDGLEKVAEHHKFIKAGRERKAPMGDYAFPGVTSSRVSTALAGFTGTLVAGGLMFGLGLFVAGGRGRKKANKEANGQK